MRRGLLLLGATGSMLAGCAVRPALPRSFALAMPPVLHEGQVAVYSELCDVPAPMRAIAQIEVASGGRERAAIERDLVNRAASLGANGIVLDPLNHWTLGAAHTSAEANSFDPFRLSRATAGLVLHSEAMTTSSPAGCRTGSPICGAR